MATFNGYVKLTEGNDFISVSCWSPSLHTPHGDHPTPRCNGFAHGHLDVPAGNARTGEIVNPQVMFMGESWLKGYQ